MAQNNDIRQPLQDDEALFRQMVAEGAAQEKVEVQPVDIQVPPVDDDLTRNLAETHQIRDEEEDDDLFGQMVSEGVIEEEGAGKVTALGKPTALPPPVTPPRETTAWEDTYAFLRELPIRSLLGGIANAANETIEAMASYYDWAGEQAMKPGLTGWLAWNFLPGGDTGAKLQLGDPEVELEKVVEGVIPKPPDPTTVGGQMAKGVVQFLAGMAGPAKALKVTRLGTVSRAAIAGAISDGTAFDPHEKGLANLIQEYPDLKNPVTEFLAVNKDDPKIIGRIKHMLEGAGAGALTDGFIKSLRVIRAARKARGVTAPIDEIHGTGAVQVDDYGGLGDPKKPLTQEIEVDVAKKKIEAAKLETGRAVPPDTPPGMLIEGDGGKGVFINMARLDTPEDVKKAVQSIANVHKITIDKARRGTITLKAQEELADQLGMTVDEMLTRRPGEAANAETLTAYRKLFVASGENIVELSKKASDANAGMVDQYNFRKALVMHHAIEKEFFGARTEVARALGSMRIPAGSGLEQAKSISAMMETMGGQALSKKFAGRIAAAAQAGVLNNQQIANMARKGAFAKTYDAFLEVWINGLLSNPVTHAVNMIGNTSVMVNTIMERAVAGRAGELMGETDGVVVGEAMQMMVGVVEGMKDQWRLLGKHFRVLEAGVKGETALAGELRKGIEPPPPGLDLSKIDLPEHQAISSANLGLSAPGPRDSFNWLGKTTDAFGAVVRSPGKALHVEDMFFKSMGYRMNLRALSLRQASREGFEGMALKKRMAVIMENPPDEIRMESVDAALYQTFTNQLGEGGQLVTRIANWVPGGRVVAPFLRVPINLTKYTFGRTPLAALSNNYRADIAAGGARAQMANTKIAMGSMTMLTVMDLVYSGHVTGGGTPDKKSYQNMKSGGWKPYSLKIGDRYYSYSRTDPFGMMFGLAANIAEFTQWSARETDDPSDGDEAIAAMMMSFSEVMVNKTYMRGVSDLVEAISDPKRYGGSYVTRLAGSLVPAGVAHLARLDDPNRKAVSSMMDALKARTPGWSKDLPNVRDRWARPIEYRSGLGWAYDVMSPIYSSRETPSPIDSEMLRLGYSPEKPGADTAFNGIPVNLKHEPWVYDRYQVLATQEAKDPVHGMGAFDYLNALVEGKLPESTIYNMKTDGPDGGKAEFIGGILARYKRLARQNLLDEYPHLKDRVEHRQREQREANLQAITQ